MIQKIATNTQIKTNNKPVSFKAKLVIDDSAYKAIKETYDIIAKFRGESSEKFSPESFLNTLKENFEKATATIQDGTVKLSHDDYFGAFSAQYKSKDGKSIFASIPALMLFKGKEPNHEIISTSLDKNYKRIFEKTLLPETNPFKQD